MHRLERCHDVFVKLPQQSVISIRVPISDIMQLEHITYCHMLPRIVGIGRGTSSHDAVLSEGSPALQIPVVETID